MRPTERLASFVVETDLEDIPSRVVELAKNLILNVFGAILAGSTEKTGKIGIDLVRHVGGEPQATVIGGGFKTSTIMAALANGISAHATDQDDTDFRSISHLTVSVLPAVLALGEFCQASGKQVLESYILGIETAGKVGAAVAPVHWNTGFHGTSIFGHVGATIGCCKLLRLGIKEIETALGIMGSFASGLRHNVGSMSKPLFAGNAAKNGVIAATLAQRGFTSVEGILEGRFGFARAFGGPNARPELMAKDLGKPYLIESPGIAIKASPCGTYGALLSQTLQDMVKEYGFSSDQVASIGLGVNTEIPNFMRYVYPNDSLEAKYSVPFVMAVTLQDGEAGLKQFTDEKTQDQKVKEIISKIKVYIHPDLPTGIDPSKLTGPERYRTYVTIRLTSGEEYSRWTESTKGFVEQPFTEETMYERYRSFASLALPDRFAEKTYKMIKTIEKVPDIEKLMALLRGV